MPVDDGSGCDQDERLFPSSPELAHADPEQLVRRRQSPARPLGVERQELLTKSEAFQDEIPARMECTDNPANQVSEPHDHGKNLTETYLLRLTVKSLILHVCDVLTRHTKMTTEVSLRS